MDQNLLFVILSVLIIYFSMGIIFTYLLNLGVGIVLFLLLLYVYYRKRFAINARLTALNPIHLYRKQKKERTYRKLKDVWTQVLKIHHPVMCCPGCQTEITIFTINLKGQCTICSTYLLK